MRGVTWARAARRREAVGRFKSADLGLNKTGESWMGCDVALRDRGSPWRMEAA
jgi:hypothetical protein